MSYTIDLHKFDNYVYFSEILICIFFRFQDDFFLLDMMCFIEITIDNEINVIVFFRCFLFSKLFVKYRFTKYLQTILNLKLIWPNVNIINNN